MRTEVHEQGPLHLAGMARRLRVSMRWLKQEAEAGRVPVLRAGRKLLFNPEAVEAALLDRAGNEGGAQ